MKLSRRKNIKRLLLAALASTSLTWQSGVVFAEDTSNNAVEVNRDNYTVNEETKTYDGEADLVHGGYSDSGNTWIDAVPSDKTVVGFRTSNSQNSSRNIVIINGGIITDRVFGGFSYDKEAADNRVIINGGTIRAIRGADTYIGNVRRNIVVINGGTIGRIIDGQDPSNVIGGMAYFINSEGVTVEDNKIILNGGTIIGDVRAGMSWLGNIYNNSIDIYNTNGTLDLTSANLYGYFGGSEHSGNTLNIYTTGITAKNIYNFNALNFYIPASAKSGDTMLTLTSSEGTDISGARINAGVQGGSTLDTGDTVTLITNPNGLNTNGTTYGTLSEGVSLNYKLTVEKSGDNSVVARIGDTTTDDTTPSDSSTDTSTVPATVITDNNHTLPQTELLGLPQIATLKLVDFMSDKLVDWLPPCSFDFEDEMEDEVNLPDVPQKEPKGYEIFITGSGGSFRTKTGNGSYIESTLKGFDVGFGRSIDYSNGRLVFAPIFEYATGDYDSYLDDGQHGKGNTKYMAGGLIGRKTFKSGFYIEASARGGKTERDFSSDTMTSNGSPIFVHYDKTSAPVFAGHLRLGRQLRLNKNNLLDYYGIYFHSHQGGMNLHLSTGENYHFSSATSSRTRLGYRLTTRTSKISRIYTGLAFQYEHNPNVVGTYKGRRTPNAGSCGASCMLEFGWMIRPNKDNPWMLDLNATGFVGLQRGLSGTIKLQKEF